MRINIKWGEPYTHVHVLHTVTGVMFCVCIIVSCIYILITHTHTHSYSPITDMSEVYENPYSARSYPDFHIFGFSW